MTGLEGTLSNARARVASLRFWCDHVVANYDVYAADHASCPGYLNVRLEVVTAADAVRSFAGTIEKRLDDSGWVTEIGDRASRWNQAASHVSDAGADVAEPSLRAVGSWRGGASPRYRAAVPPQRTALTGLQDACADMKRGCVSAETAGTSHFGSVEALAADLVGALDYHFAVTPGIFSPGYQNPGTTFTPQPPVYGPESPVQQSEGPGYVCPVGSMHVTAADVTSRFVTPREAAVSALETADTTLRTAVVNAFSDAAPRRPGPQPDGEYGRVSIAQRLGPWPVPGAAS